MDLYDEDEELNEELEEFEQDQYSLNEEESPQGGVILQILGHTGEVEDIIIGLDNIRMYMELNYPKE